MGTALRFTASLAILLLGLELVLRTWLVPPQFKYWDPEIGELNVVGSRIVWSREGWATRRVNSLGLVGPEPAEKPSGRRVLLLGNSFTEALNVSREESFEGLVESLLPGVEVVNGAHSGWSMANEVLLLERLSPVLDPDVVVAQISGVSLFDRDSAHLQWDGSGWEVAPPEPPTGLRASIKRYTDPIATRSALVTMLLQQLNTLLRAQRDRLAVKFDPNGDERPRAEASKTPSARILDEERSATRYIVNRMKAQGADLVLLFIPRVDYGVGECAPQDPARRAMYHDLSVELGVDLVDPSDDFCRHYLETSRPPHGFHNLLMADGHLNATGHRIVARDLAMAIEGLGH